MKREFKDAHRGLANIDQGITQLRRANMDDIDGKKSYLLTQLGKLTAELSDLVARDEGVEAHAMKAAYDKLGHESPSPGKPPTSRRKK